MIKNAYPYKCSFQIIDIYLTLYYTYTMYNNLFLGCYLHAGIIILGVEATGL